MTLRILLALLAAFAVARADTIPESVIDNYLAVAEPAEKDPKDWKIKIGLGATVTDGNSDTVTFALSFDAVKQLREELKLTLTEVSTYAESGGVESANEHIFVERLDWKLNELSNLFQTLLLEHDNQEKLRIRIVLAVGYARKLIHKQDFDLWVEAGPGVIYEDYRTTGENTEAILVITVRWVLKVSKDLTYEQTISVWPSLNHGGEGRVLAEAKFTTPVGDGWTVELAIRDVFNSEPPLGNVKNDLTIVLTLVVSF